MLRSVVGAMAANMMLVQCNSGVPISLACSTWSASVLSTASPEPRPVGTSKARDQAGRRLEPVSSADMKHRGIEAEVGVILPHAVQNHRDAPGQRNHRTLGATTARQLRRPGPQPVARPRCIMTVAAWHSARRRLTSPALVIPPEMSRSPDWLRDGVRPTHGPTFFEEVNRAGSSTADR